MQDLGSQESRWTDDPRSCDELDNVDVDEVEFLLVGG